MVGKIRGNYPVGTRIALTAPMAGERDMPTGLTGLVDHIDDQGQLHMKWSNGRALAVIPGEDSFRILSRPLQSMNEKYTLSVTKDDEFDRFYSNSENDEQLGCVGHTRFDFGTKGKEFWHTWWGHREELNTQPFKDDLNLVVNNLREMGLLQDLSAMSEFCQMHPDAMLENGIYGFKAETEKYEFYIRCDTTGGNDNGYIYGYDKSQQTMAQGIDKNNTPQMGGMCL